MTILEYGKAIMEYDEPNNLVAIYNNAMEKFSPNPYIAEKDDAGEFQWMTYGEFGVRVSNLRAGMMKLGVAKGDAIGIIANNRKEWAVAAFAGYTTGAIWIPMYEKELFDTWKYIITDGAIKFLLVANTEIYERVKGFVDEIPTLEHIYFIDGEGEKNMAALEIVGAANPRESVPEPDLFETATIIYTSGTTGDPKGVRLSHANWSYVINTCFNLYQPLDETVRIVSILPWAHVYAQLAEVYLMQTIGGSIALTTVPEMAGDIIKTDPTHLMCVPRIWNKIYNAVHKVMDDTGGMKAKLFYAAKDAAEKKRLTGKAGFKYKLLDKLVFDKVREKFGTRLRESITASAKTDTNIANFFYDLGLPIYDVYGMTELAPAATMNCPGHHKLGTVGQPIPRTKVVIDNSMTGTDDGEVIVYGPQVMQGYHNKPEKTAAVIVTDADGIRGMRMGDLGHLDDEGYLYITGRIKNEFKLANGLYVHPAAIEEYVKLLPWVLNCMVYGDGKGYTVSLVIPDLTFIKTVAADMQLTLPPEEIVKIKEVQTLMGKEIRNHLKEKFSNYEIPKKFLASLEEFTIENGCLTNTLKLKRRKVLEKYKISLEALYTE